MNRYNVILTYKDGSAFDCAVGVSLERAEQIKAEIEQQQSEHAFSYRDVKSITITKGGDDA